MAVWLRWTNCARALLLTCWNTDGVCGRKLELGNFFRQHCFDICLLNETHLRPGEVCQFANCIGHRADQLTRRCDSCTMLYHAVPVKGLRYVGATVMLACRPLRILAVYLSACLGGGVPVLMVGDLYAKNMDWNFRLITTRGRPSGAIRPVKIPFDLQVGHTNHGSIQLLYHPWCPRHRTHKKPSDRSVCDHMLRTGLRSLI
jgi:hypothetical protein